MLRPTVKDIISFELEMWSSVYFTIALITITLDYTYGSDKSNLLKELRHNIWNGLNFQEILEKQDNPDYSSILKNAEHEMDKFPAKFVHKMRSFKSKDGCAKFPKLNDIRFINKHWQVHKNTRGSFNLLNAYYDNRSALSLPVIRILSSVKSSKPTFDITCQFWFEDMPDPIFGQVDSFKYLYNRNWGHQDRNLEHPFLLTCQIPKRYSNKVPVAVSLVQRLCESATNILKVKNNRPANGVMKKFGVCVKQLDFLYKDMSVILVEWLELLFSMGAEKVQLYNLSSHSNIIKVMEYYKKQGKVEFVPITLPGFQPNAPSLYHLYLANNMGAKHFMETILLNDCFYSNMYKFEWLAILDVDELIMPVGDTKSWSDILVTANQSSDTEGYAFRNIYFFDDSKQFKLSHPQIALYLRFMNLVYRGNNYSPLKFNSKSFFSTNSVEAVHNHYALSCIEDRRCKWHEVPTTIAQLQHYCTNKKRSNDCSKYENNTAFDSNIWKYKDVVAKRVLKVFKDLKFVKK